MAECETCGGAISEIVAKRAISRKRKPRFCGRDCWLRSAVKPKPFVPSRPKNLIQHGHNTREGGQSLTYSVWHSMKQRCLNPRNHAYTLYGARGITVCERWMDFTNFLADMGERSDPDLSIDRIEPDGNYEPGNCRWATQKEQCNNWTRGNQFVVNYKGADYTLQELADKFEIDRYTLRRRVTTSRWPEAMWHLPPSRSIRPSSLMSEAEQARKVFPRGRS